MQEFDLGTAPQDKAAYLGLDEFLGSHIGILAFPSSSPHSVWEDPLTTFAHTKSISVEADEVAVPKKGSFKDSSRLLSSTEAPNSIFSLMLLNNRYEFVKKLGEGVYGSVYLANDTLTGRYATNVIIST